MNLSDIPSVIPNSGWLHTGWGATNPIGFRVAESITFTAIYEIDDDKTNSGNTPNTGDSTKVWRYVALMSGALSLMIAIILLDIKRTLFN